MATGTTNLTTFINSNADLLKTMIDNSDYTKDLVIPDNITVILSYAFYRKTGFKGRLILPNGLLSLGTSDIAACFSNCTGFTGDLTIPNSVTYISATSSTSDGVFYNCKGFNGTLTIGNGIKALDYNNNSLFGYQFYNCSGFTKLILSENLTSIGYSTFRGCSGLLEANLPSSVTMLYGRAFYGCTGLQSVDCYRTTPPSIQTDTFTNVTAKFYVPAYNIYAYKTATNWTAKATQICGRKDYIIDDTFEDFAQGAYTTTTWYATKADLVAGTNPIASGTTVGATGTYYCTLT